ncbi:MAG: YigZ family protein, partial [Bacillota bacterium]
MQSIKRPVTHETIIKHSRFIAFLAPVFTKAEADKFIASIKSEHPDANHHCFAYIVGDEGIVQKAEDDGEPSKTAGVPMLETLKKNTLTNIVAVVVRYFGGIKLGAGGLIRAYGKSVSDALEKAVPSERTEVLSLSIRAGFEWTGTV